MLQTSKFSNENQKKRRKKFYKIGHKLKLVQILDTIKIRDTIKFRDTFVLLLHLAPSNVLVNRPLNELLEVQVKALDENHDEISTWGLNKVYIAKKKI